MSEPADEISDWAIAASQALCELAVSERLDVAFAHLEAQTPTVDEAYQIICGIARTSALTLRPQGWSGGPIGRRPSTVDQLPASSVQIRRLAFADFQAATQLIGAAARSDADMVRAWALAALVDDANSPDPRDPILRARGIGRCMLLVLRVEPVAKTPTEGTLDV